MCCPPFLRLRRRRHPGPGHRALPESPWCLRASGNIAAHAVPSERAGCADLAVGNGRTWHREHDVKVTRCPGIVLFWAVSVVGHAQREPHLKGSGVIGEIILATNVSEAELDPQISLIRRR